uniref:Uncharacterized protein n=1 Tax=Callorhinchus milii TaxID=7868 RepID=A0A4W3J0V1_CALMI
PPCPAPLPKLIKWTPFQKFLKLSLFRWLLRMSISHCMTGAGLATGLSLFSPHSCSPFLSKIPSLSPLTYHTFNGIHHLDMTISGLAVLRVGFL